MTDTAEAPAATPVGGGRSRPGLLVGGLAVTQTVGYGVLFYAFSVLLTPIAVDLHASTAAVTGALTTSIVVAAGAAIPGRTVARPPRRPRAHDRRFAARRRRRAGLVPGAASVAALRGVRPHRTRWRRQPVRSRVPGRHRHASGRATGTGHCWPSRSWPGSRRASSFRSPACCLDRVGWRTTLVVLAVVLAAHHRPGARQPRAQPARISTITSVTIAVARPSGRRCGTPAFWLLTVAFVAQAAAVSAVGVLLVTYLRRLGHTTTVAARPVWTARRPVRRRPTRHHGHRSPIRHDHRRRPPSSPCRPSACWPCPTSAEARAVRRSA